MDFSEIYNEAVIRAGSHEKLMELLPKPCSSDLLSKISDDRYLSTMARCIFRAGFVWRVVDNKWPNFEEVFLNFNPLAVAYLSDERLEEIATYKSIIRQCKNFTYLTKRHLYFFANLIEYFLKSEKILHTCITMSLYVSVLFKCY